jgi:hypothetical protein
MLGCRLEPVSAERLPAADLLEAVLTEQAWEIRKEWGATYGIQADVGVLPGAAHLTIEGAVETSRTGAAVEKLLGLVTGIATQGPDFKTFTLKRWDLARQYDQASRPPRPWRAPSSAPAASAGPRTCGTATRIAWPTSRAPTSGRCWPPALGTR